MYLAVVMGLFSRPVAGWSLDTSMTEHLDREGVENGACPARNGSRAIGAFRSGSTISVTKVRGCVLLENKCRISMSIIGTTRRWDLQSIKG